MLYDRTSDLSWSTLALFAAGSILAYFVILVPVYRIFFHPLSKYPGSKLWAVSDLPWGFAWMSGKMHLRMMELHDKYGPVIRTGPNELSFAVPEAWEDVFGRYKPGVRKENSKPSWYCSPASHDIVGASLGDHGRMRRLLYNGFTNSAMLEQEPLISAYVDLFIQRLHEKSEGGKATIDMFQWFAYCTFDIVGDLSFGESFGCLRESMMHPWIEWVFSNIRLTHILLLCQRIPFFYLFLPVMATMRLFKDYKEHDKTLRAVCDRRMALDSGRPDFMEVMMSKKGSLYFTKDEIYSNAMLLTLGGSETSSNTLSGLAYIVSTRPDVKAKLERELKATFTRESEMDMLSVSKMPYLQAVIEEVLRYFPPGPNSMPRMTPPEGNEILGEWVPGNTVLAIPHRVMYRSERNWTRPNEFIPERWLDEGKNSEFANDRRDGFHPFSYGPRSCLAMNLAYAEMRYILSRLIWNFEIEIDEQSLGWMDSQRAYLIWEKPALYVHLRPKEKV